VGYGYNTGASDAHGVLFQPLVEHWDGTTWHAVPTPPIPAPRGTLQGVSAVSAADVWAVGASTTDAGITQTLIEHWDGTAWSIVPSPNPSTQFNVLRSVHGLTAGNAWAVGSATIIERKSTTVIPLIEHWHAGAWHAVKGPTLNSPAGEFLGVASKGASHVWAVGDVFDSSIPAERTLVEEFIDGKWVVVPSPNGSTLDNQLWGVAAGFDGTVWAVGHTWASPNGPLNTLAMRWDGTSWSIVASASPGVRNQLMGATMVGTTLWAAGTTDDGTAWKALVERSTP
jgi:hypothetical protein